MKWVKWDSDGTLYLSDEYAKDFPVRMADIECIRRRKNKIGILMTSQSASIHWYETIESAIEAAAEIRAAWQERREKG